MSANIQQDYVALLGTKGGPAIRQGSAMPTSNLLVLNGTPVVVDCGLGVTRGLVDQGIQLEDVSVVFITHLHSDHYLELGPLLHTAWTAGLTTPVTVYGPSGLERYWEGFVAAMKADIDLRREDEGLPDLHKMIEIQVIDAGPVAEFNGISVSAIRTEHPPLVDCFALSFKSDTIHVVFSGDTAPIPALESFAANADLLVHEAMLESALPALLARIGNGSDKLMAQWRRSHTFAHDAARIATQAGVTALALSHLIPSDDPSYTDAHWREAASGSFEGHLFIGRDGLRIDLPIAEG